MVKVIDKNGAKTAEELPEEVRESFEYYRGIWASILGRMVVWVERDGWKI